MTPSASDLQSYLGGLRAEVEHALEQFLETLDAPPVIAEPVRYALLGPGKRLRPCLTLAVAEAIGRRLGLRPTSARQRALPAACAIEMIHTYSLVHDDLPAMDDDDLRRGRPTTHVVYGDGMAVLAGDALLTDAFGLLARWPSPVVAASDEPGPTADQRLAALICLADAAGIAGMVGGQAIDLAAAAGAGPTALTVDAAALEDMHLRKTGALIRASCAIGAILVGADHAAVSRIDRYARELGLAFQIVDDLLDVEGSDAALGKTAGKDAASGKPTFTSFYGVPEARERAAACVERATAALGDSRDDDWLRAIAAWSLTRQK